LHNRRHIMPYQLLPDEPPRAFQFKDTDGRVYTVNAPTEGEAFETFQRQQKFANIAKKYGGTLIDGGGQVTGSPDYAAIARKYGTTEPTGNSEFAPTPAVAAPSSSDAIAQKYGGTRRPDYPAISR